MAKAISNIRETENQAERARLAQLDKVESLFVEHTDELEQTMRLLNLMQEKGLLDAGEAVLEQGHDLLQILVEQATRPGSVGGIKSLIGMVQGITKMDANLVSAVFNGISDASQVISGGDTDHIRDLWDIVRLLRDRDVNAGLTAIFAVLKAVGEHLDRNKHVDASHPVSESFEEKQNPVAT